MLWFLPRVVIFSRTTKVCRNGDHLISILSFMRQLEEVLILKPSHWRRFVYCSLLDIEVLFNHLLLHLLE